MAIVQIISTLSHRSLMNRSRRDLEDRLSMIMRSKDLTRNDIADAIMLLARRLPEDKPS